MLKGLKNTIDPTNVFACGNLIWKMIIWDELFII
jgi:hypothetical protein